MRKQVDRLVVAVALCLLAGSWFLATENTARADFGASCLAINGTQVCQQTGNTACQYAQDHQNYCAGPCEWCDDNTVIANYVCVVTYTGTCNTNGGGGSVTCSATANRMQGTCTSQNGGACSCMYAQSIGPCGAGYTYFRCDPNNQ